MKIGKKGLIWNENIYNILAVLLLVLMVGLAIVFKGPLMGAVERFINYLRFR